MGIYDSNDAFLLGVLVGVLLVVTAIALFHVIRREIDLVLDAKHSHRKSATPIKRYNTISALVMAVVLAGGYTVNHDDKPAKTGASTSVEMPEQTKKVEPAPQVDRKPAKKPTPKPDKPKPKPKPKPKATIPVNTNSVWDKIAQCESSGNWSNADTGNNGHYGGLQFSIATWKSVGGPGMPHQHSRETQIKYAKILQKRSGWGQWACAHARFD